MQQEMEKGQLLGEPLWEEHPCSQGFPPERPTGAKADAGVPFWVGKYS